MLVVGFVLVTLGVAVAVGGCVYKLVQWRESRQARKSMAAIRQMEDEYYAGLHRSLLLHVDEMLRGADRP